MNHIGTWNEDGTVWPEVDINGQPYAQPATIVGLDDTHFVVIPVNFTDWERLDTIRPQESVADDEA